MPAAATATDLLLATAPIRAAEGVLFREVSGEAVLLEIDSGKYYGLNESGTRMWQLLTRHGGLQPTLAALCEEFDAPESELRRDLQELVSALLEHGLVEVVAGELARPATGTPLR